MFGDPAAFSIVAAPDRSVSSALAVFTRNSGSDLLVLETGNFSYLLGSTAPDNAYSSTQHGGFNPSFELAAVPLPAGLPLLLGGLATLELVRRRRA